MKGTLKIESKIFFVSLDHWDFFMVFSNLVVGVTSWLFRMILSILSLGFFSLRIDETFIVSPFYFGDTGIIYYILFFFFRASFFLKIYLHTHFLNLSIF